MVLLLEFVLFSPFSLFMLFNALRDLLIGIDLFSLNDIIAFISQRFCQLVLLSFVIKKNIADFPVL